MNKLFTLIYILLAPTVFGQVTHVKNDQLHNITTGTGTPSSNTVTATTGAEYKEFYLFLMGHGRQMLTGRSMSTNLKAAVCGEKQPTEQYKQ